MSSFAPAFHSQNTAAKISARRPLSVETLQRRKVYRRQTLSAQMIGYFSSSVIIAIYGYAGTVPPMLAVIFLTFGCLSIGLFFVLSESQFNERYEDHYLSFPQVVAHTAIQIGFLIAAPEIGYIFLSCMFLIFSYGALRMTSTQSAVALLLMTLSVAPIFLMMAKPVSLPGSTQPERLAGILCFVVTIGQCAFVGRYGSALRSQLYKNSQDLQIAYKRIEELAEIDELTGAYNRRSIMRTLDQEIDRATRLDHPCSIALIDLDWFKRINDTFGHLTGDEVLRTFAITMFANIRSIDAFGRYGGEEFLLVLPETSHEDAVRALDRLRLIISDLDWTTLSPGLSLTMSAGVATLLPNETAESFLAHADTALYKAKRHGRNRIDGVG